MFVKPCGTKKPQVMAILNAIGFYITFNVSVIINS